jgi:flagellar biosynthesis/type III secretory pathway protein FliH
VRAAPVSETVARELGAVRLAALEAFDRLRARLLAALASEVLARELALAPADMQALSERILRDLAEEEPVGLVLCASDAIGIRTTLPVRVDSALRPGDLIVEVRDGEIDARFDLRLVAVLEPLAQADALDR